MDRWSLEPLIFQLSAFQATLQRIEQVCQELDKEYTAQTIYPQIQSLREKLLELESQLKKLFLRLSKNEDGL